MVESITKRVLSKLGKTTAIFNGQLVSLEQIPNLYGKKIALIPISKGIHNLHQKESTFQLYDDLLQSENHGKPFLCATELLWEHKNRNYIYDAFGQVTQTLNQLPIFKFITIDMHGSLSLIHGQLQNITNIPTKTITTSYV